MYFCWSFSPPNDWSSLITQKYFVLTQLHIGWRLKSHQILFWLQYSFFGLLLSPNFPCLLVFFFNFVKTLQTRVEPLQLMNTSSREFEDVHRLKMTDCFTICYAETVQITFYWYTVKLYEPGEAFCSVALGQFIVTVLIHYQSLAKSKDL